MISIEKPVQPPEALIVVQQELEERLLKQEKRFKWTLDHYSRPIKKNLAALYNSKCAFCEQKLTENSTEQKSTIEHYRPKETYWWLGNEWTNLFPTCRKCNDLKKNDFPLNYNGIEASVIPLTPDGSIDRTACKAGNKVLLQELPKIIHPEVQSPERFFEFLDNGEISIADNNLSSREKEQAGYMIQRFLKRASLVERRKKHVDNFTDEFKRVVVNFLTIMEGNEPTERELKLGFYPFLEKLFTSNNYEKEFSRLGHYMIDHFDRFFIDSLPESSPTARLKEILRQARILFLKEKTNNTP